MASVNLRALFADSLKRIEAARDELREKFDKTSSETVRDRIHEEFLRLKKIYDAVGAKLGLKKKLANIRSDGKRRKKPGGRRPFGKKR